MRHVWLAILLWLTPAVANAADVSVTARVQPDSVETRTNFQYVVTATVRGDEPIQIVKPPRFGKLKQIGQRRMPQLININGATTRRLTTSFTLRAQEEGTFEIQPPTVQIGNERLQPNPVTVRVVARGELSRQRQQTASDRRYFIDVDVAPRDGLYVGEQVTLSWDLFVDGTRFDIRPTSTHDPSLDEFWVESIPSNDQDRIVTYDGRLMRQIPLWRYAAFPLNSGPVTLEPVEVEVAVGTFTRRAVHNVKSEPVQIEVQPLPPDAPRGFDEGNVGVFNFSVRPEQNASRVGQAVTVEVTISGEGHLARLSLPELPEIPGMRRSDVEETSKSRIRNGRVGGRKTTKYTLIPLEEGSVTIPSLRFVYFDTRQEEYVVRKSDPITLRIGPGTAPPEPVEASKLTKRDVTGGEDLVQNLIDRLNPPRDDVTMEAARDPAHFPWAYWALGAVSFLVFLGTAFRPRLERLRERSRPERTRKTATREVFELLDEAGDDPDAIYGALRDWLSSAFDIPRGAVTSRDLPDAFDKRGLDRDAAERLAAVLEKCEEARFAPDGADTTTLADEAREVAQWLRDHHDASGGVAAITLVALASLLLAGTVIAAPNVEDALQAQGAEKWEAAAEAWAEIAETQNDAVDVWYNLGTTAALDRDWSTARHALERAAYLSPLDSDIGENRDIVARIVRLHAIERSRTGRTIEGDETLFWWEVAAHIHAHVAGVLLIAFWLLAAGLIVLRRRTESPAVRDAAFVGLVLAILFAVCATGGVALRTRLLATTQPVVLMAEDLELREGPNEAAKLMRIPSTLIPGTLLRVTAERDDWVKLTWHDDAGWTRRDAVRHVR